MDRRELLVAAAALVLAPEALARRLGGMPLALVTADLQSELVAVRLTDGRVARRIRTLPYPRSIEAVGDLAVVAHSEIGAVSIVDGPTLLVAHVVRGFREPRYTAAHPDGRHAFVSDARLGEVVALDVLRGVVVGRARVGAGARHLSLRPDGRRLWVALGSKARELVVVDTSRPEHPRPLGRIRPPFLAHDVAFAPDGERVWVSSGDRFQLALFDPSGTLRRRVSGDWPPQHVTFAGAAAYVTSGWSGTLRRHRLDGRPLGTTPVPVGSYNVQEGWGVILTPGLGTGTLCVLDERGVVVRTGRVARSSHDACFVMAR